jgi:hypothetical protein
MECRFPTTSTAATVLMLAMGIAPARAAGRHGDAPVLQLAGGDFPELAVHVPRHDAMGVQAALDCDQIRAKRIDELDPLWKKAVDRIHLDCDDLGMEGEGLGTVATAITAYLKPGAVQFAGVPVVEVRLMDSDLWGDRQYLLDKPYADIVEAMQAHLESRCRAQQDDPSQLAQGDCTLVQQPDGLYLDTSEVGGIWLHTDLDDIRRTVYAEAWAD